MLELRQKTSEILTFEKHYQITYIRWLKRSIQRIVKSIYTPYFSSFSNFKILHQLIKSFVNPILNRVFGSSEHYFLKSDLNSLKNLKIDRLQTKQTIIHTRRLQSVPMDKVCKVYGSICVNLIIRFFCGRGFRSPILTFLFFCRRGMPKWHSYPGNAKRRSYR